MASQLKVVAAWKDGGFVGRDISPKDCTKASEREQWKDAGLEGRLSN